MKLATIVHNGVTVIAQVHEESQTATRLVSGADTADMQALIAAYPEVRDQLKFDDQHVAFSELQFLAPLPRPRRNIVCVGKNYFDHAHEFTRSGFDSSASGAADAVPSAPILFTKMPETVVATGTPIGYPNGGSQQLDYEAELGVVIGKAGLGIRKDEAMGYVFGYVIINDLTARDLQGKHKQWFLGKSFETSCPMGPWITTADEIDGGNLNVKCWVNDELRQNANTKDLIFDIPTLIETLSAGTRILPGDIIATGTPVGVGIGFTPPRFLSPSDVVDIEIDGLGRLSNTVR
ncbi:fumarylacetoacetate hydrolase family protein [Pusillimonas sp.]|uniref:fumarylacetoacetate hydrolase family protein n=1 Tax=Pusillimonas sp. TaxID=3040095 RepID=UPI0037C63299